MVMKRKSSSQVVTQERTATSPSPKQRPRSPGAQTKQSLTASEEQVLRMRKGIGVDLDTPLESKTNNPELLAKLRDIEAQLFLQAGQMEPLSKKQQIIDKLKRR